jgi:hypothetical protein
VRLVSHSVLCTLAILAACSDSEPTEPTPIIYPASAQIAAPQVWGSLTGLSIAGGFGSGLAVDPHDPSVFYILTDRGPNVMTTVTNQLLFLLPTFNPQIGKFRLVGDSLKLISSIGLKTAAGAVISGLPNPAGVGATGETGIGPTGALLTTDPEGIDSEGLAIAPDGSFWISDEYGPHIVHVDITGRTLERINPYGSGTGGRKIPLVYARRRPNRGMEGVAITPDGKTVVGLMQSPLDNPTAAIGRASNVNRIVAFDVATGATKEFVYETDAVGLYASDITAITNTTFLVDERDANIPTTAAPGVRRVYKIDLAGATDVTDPSNSAAGKLFGGLALEALTPVQRSTNGITPVSKTLVFDLMTMPGGYPHDKFEGLAIVSGNMLAVSNDDDFGVIDNGQVGIMQKTLPTTNKQDRMTLYFIRLATALR